MPQPSEVTRLLVAWRDGDAAALDQLVPLVEAELRRLAHWTFAASGQDTCALETMLMTAAA